MGNIISGPSDNGFNWHSTADQVAEGIDLNGKVIVVTGANSGMGLESARVLSSHGAFVVMTARDLTKGEQAKAEIVAAGAPEANLKLMQLDLASFASIRKFADEFKSLGKPLHVLMSNAGVMMCPYERTTDGFEMQIGTNHLGHFLLTYLLMDNVLQAGPGARIVNVSSAAHKMPVGALPATVEEIDAQWFHTPEESYSIFTAYGRSKIANIYFTTELQRKYQDKGVIAIALHPGAVSTNLGRHLWGGNIGAMFQNAITNILLKDVQKGAATQVFAAIHPLAEKQGGLYLDCSNVAEPTVQAQSESDAKRFWEASEKACNISW